MNLQLDTRNLILSALIALVALASAFAVLAPKASAATEDCPPSDVCLWETENFSGTRSFFSGSETGCHDITNINPRSMRNHTGNHTATFFPGPFGIGPSGEHLFGGPYTGSMCID
jgi:hypothetical protein